MTSLVLATLAKATMALAGAWVVTLLIERRASAAARHLVWTVALASLLALPVLSVVLPTQTLTIHLAVQRRTLPLSPALREPLGDGAPTATGMEVPPPAPAAQPPTAPAASLPETTATALVVVYMAGVLLLLSRLLIEWWRVQQMARRAVELDDPGWTRLLIACARRIGMESRVRLLRSREQLMPMVLGIRRPVIIVPAVADTWTDDRRRAVLLHELSHVARHDCLTQTMASIACALYWIHPGVWWAGRRLRIERELACDDRVLAAGTDAPDYAGHLLELAYALGGHRAPAIALTMARHGRLEGRLRAALDPTRARTAPTARAFAAGLVMAAAALVPVAAIQTTIVRDAPGSRAGSRPAVQLAQASAQAPAQTPATSRDGAMMGTWTIEPADQPGFVHLQIRQGNSLEGHTIALSRLAGLVSGQVAPGSPAVHFSLQREAGTFVFDGTFRSGRGGGTVTFTPSETFPTELVKRGFARPTLVEQYALARADVGLAFVDEVTALGYARPTLMLLVQSAQHGVNADYARELSQLGYRLGTVENLIRQRDHGVDPQFIRDLRAQGLTNLTADDLVRARDHGVDARFAGELRALGHGDLSMEQLVAARDHGVSPEYVREFRQLGYAFSLADLTRARDHGIGSDYVKELAALGYTSLTLDRLVAARDHGVSPGYIRAFNAQGYERLSLDDVIRLRDHGVSPEWAQDLKKKGRTGLTVNDLIRLRDTGSASVEQLAPRLVAVDLRAKLRNFLMEVDRLLQ